MLFCPGIASLNSTKQSRLHDWERIYRYEASSGREKKKFLTVVSPHLPFGEGGKRTLPLLNDVLYLAVAFLLSIKDATSLLSSPMHIDSISAWYDWSGPVCVWAWLYNRSSQCTHGEDGNRVIHHDLNLHPLLTDLNRPNRQRLNHVKRA